MTYTPTNWQNGDTITAEKLNNIENGIVGVETDVSQLKSQINEIDGIVYKPTGNLLDFGYVGGTWEQGGIGNANPYMCRTKINVTPNTTLYGVVNGTKMAKTTALSAFTLALFCAVYDDTDTQIVSATNLSNSSGQLTTSINLPATASYVIAYLSSGNWGNQFTPTTLDNAVEAFAYLGYENLPYTEVVANYIPYPAYNDGQISSVNNKITEISGHQYKYTGNMLDFGFIGNTWNQGGVGNTNPYMCKSNPIPMTAGKTIYGVINATKYAETFNFALMALMVTAFNSSNVELGNAALSLNTEQGTGAFVTPANTAYVVAVFTTTTWGDQFTPSDLDNAVSAFAYMGYDNISYVDVAANYVLYNEYNENKITKLDLFSKYWTGKKIVWFGTSIPAGGVSAGDEGYTGAYPNRISRMLGATVYNEAVGSSCVRGGSYKDISEGDPMGWAGMSAIAVMLSLSLSQAEKQDIIDNWDSKWKDIIDDPETYDATKTSTYLASSWDAKLAKYLTGGSVGPVDLYVFDHGFNDGVNNYGYTDLDDAPATQDDRTYWFGAMNFLVGKILADNPEARILIIGHYNYGADASSRGADYNNKYVCDAQKAYAESWGFCCVKTWELLGLSMNNIDVSGTPTPVIYARYPDHIHPVSDTSGHELQRYAEALAPQIALARGT